ncbi:hypothetical protein GCM10027275_50470 [Rhabdobacter roseus]|uniref:Uncharacterized protein n=1 Tax=Rhabdobacter roseus TaxID=1655419 RepID=A0A840U4V5_9BACT|nr:hypothetical protein [Rhabdobacter roseus]MBB5287120.1 hypothetical protein [Rhabdobacter roseus]
MTKKIAIALPLYLKKFFLYEYQGYQVERPNGSLDEIHVDKTSELGKLIHLVSRPIPFTQAAHKPTGAGVLSIRYYVREKIYEVPVEKLPLLAYQMEEIFRRTLICEVRGVHDVVGGDYGPYVARVLERRGIVRDVDLDYQTARKIYRDHLEKNKKKQAKIFA